MDKTTKFILGLIAVSLIGINIQMWNGKLIKEAHAVASHRHYPSTIVGFERKVKTVVVRCRIHYTDNDGGHYYLEC